MNFIWIVRRSANQQRISNELKELRRRDSLVPSISEFISMLPRKWWIFQMNSKTRKRSRWMQQSNLHQHPSPPSRTKSMWLTGGTLKSLTLVSTVLHSTRLFLNSGRATQVLGTVHGWLKVAQQAWDMIWERRWLLATTEEKYGRTRRYITYI